jgi:SAM-dependent methyltransferase
MKGTVVMDAHRTSAIAHGDHPIAAPLSDETVRRLLERAIPAGTGRVLDLGCGQGHWLARAMAGRPGLRATGVDIDAAIIADASEMLARADLLDRTDLYTSDAKTVSFPHTFELVLAVGVAHAFGGLLPTLAAAREHLSANGVVVVGDGFWEREPDGATLDAGFAADEFEDLATTVDRVTGEGWVPVYGHVSTTEEWHDYEFSWTGTLSRWALDHPSDPYSVTALEAAEAHRKEWLHGYRGVLGFITMVLRARP